MFFYKNFYKVGCSLLLVFLLFSSCSTPYHWVRLKSSNPIFLEKKDTSILSPSMSSLERMNPNSPMPMTLDSEKVLRNINLSRISPDHGSVAIANTVWMSKALQIQKSLSEERKQALKSPNSSIKTKAIQETLHEQLNKNHLFSRMNDLRKEKIEQRISKSLVGSHSGTMDGLGGLNNYIWAGLFLLVVSLLFFLIPSIGFIGVILDVVAVVLIVLGLVELLG